MKILFLATASLGPSPVINRMCSLRQGSKDQGRRERERKGGIEKARRGKRSFFDMMFGKQG